MLNKSGKLFVDQGVGTSNKPYKALFRIVTKIPAKTKRVRFNDPLRDFIPLANDKLIVIIDYLDTVHAIDNYLHVDQKGKGKALRSWVITRMDYNKKRLWMQERRGCWNQMWSWVLM